MERRRIAIIGGTGALGSGIALRCVAAGHDVVIGSRDPGRGTEHAAELMATLGDRAVGSLRAAGYAAAAQAGDIVILTVRYAQHRETLELLRPVLAGKILVDTTVPLVPPKVMRVQLPPEGSAGQIAQTLLGEDVRVVSAFQSVAAHHLAAMEEIPCDVIVTGDDRAARAEVIALAGSMGMRAFHGGPICNAAAAEALTSVLIFMNKEYQAHSGIAITGVEPKDGAGA